MIATQHTEGVKRIALSGNLAIALAVKQAEVDVIPAYPISPSTTVAEALAQYVAQNELDAEFLPVESEHSAISAAIGAAASGARTFTVTSAQGLLLMHEILFMASGLRMPIVMAVANRAVSAPINIWNDHSDVMAQRDVGWIQFFVETVQEAYDRTLQAFRIAEDKAVRLPVMVNFDGVTLSHTFAPIHPLADPDAQAFCPRVPSPFRLDPEHPVSIGGFAWPDHYYEAKYQAARALEDSVTTISRVEELFEDLTGRRYRDVDAFMADDGRLLLIASGSVCGTIKAQVRRLRSNGFRVGLLSLKTFRPFPTKTLLALLDKAKAVGVVDRALTPGGVAGPVFTEVSSLLYTAGEDVPALDFIVGLGGRDVTPREVEKMFVELDKIGKMGRAGRPLRYLGLRE